MLVSVSLLGLAVYVGAGIYIGLQIGDYHVIGFMGGWNGFLQNPIGRGLGVGGNFSEGFSSIDWSAAQHAGSVEGAVESAVGVMLYQMGIGAFVFFGFVAALAVICRSLFLKTGDEIFAFGFIALVVTSANAVLQEEAYLSPLALGFSLLLIGVSLGSYWRDGLSGTASGK